MTREVTTLHLEMRDIAKHFGATAALDRVSLHAYSGEVLALVGENGSGKSTLMKVLSGAHKPDAGQMWRNGHPFAPANPHDARASGVAMIYQELSLALHLTVEENILLGMEPSRLGWIQASELRAKALQALSHFSHAEIQPDKKVGELSVAARQLVEIARALAVGCRILVLDEPTSSLSAQDAQRLFELIKELKSQGMAIVYISHFLEEVKEISDRITVLRDGRTVGGGRTADMSIEQIVSLMVGRQIKVFYPHSARTPCEVLLEISDLAGTVKPTSASFALRRGEVLGIAGLRDAGRTELLRCLFGLDPVRRGKVKVGAYLGPASPMLRWAQGIGMLSEDRTHEGLALSLSIADNVTLTRLKGFGPAGFVLPSRQAQATRGWIDKLNIRSLGPEQPVSSLSGGNQQKVALARLLQHDVDVLLLDEPTRGIDVGAKATIYQIIDELATGTGGGQKKSILMVSSYLPELIGVCDRVAVMCRGQLRQAHSAEDVDEHALMVEALGQEGIGDVKYPAENL